MVIPLRKAATVTGVVRERGTGPCPSPASEMTFGPLGGERPDSAKTDAQGRYTFPSLPGEVEDLAASNAAVACRDRPGQRTGKISRSPRGRAGSSWSLGRQCPPLRRSGSWCATSRASPSPTRRISAESSARRDIWSTDDRGESALDRDRAGGRGDDLEAHRHERMTDRTGEGRRRRARSP